ncbi:MAG TPA: hypothetical protein VK686_00895 [Bryobacteraceae bacterium]|nr:hypothetical protein [Bryobacteraceae bacterium]
MSSQLPYDPGKFYVWRASDGFAIHLGLNVVTQLTAQISRAGSEAAGMRGILIGRTVDAALRTTVIEDFQLITPAADNSPYSDFDDAPMEIACRMTDVGSDQRAVGFFGVEREGRLNMRERDLETFSRLFCETGKVALLIQTSRRGNESDAALFYWQHGGAYPRDFGFGFPFDRAQLADGHPGWRYPDPLENTPIPVSPYRLEAPETPKASPPKPVPPMPPPPASRMPREGIRWSRLVPTAAVVALGICALQLATNTNHSVSAAPSATGAASSIQNKQTSLGLAVVSRPHQLEIRWNRESAAIADSDRGVMKITEAGITQAIPFDQRQLRDGYVAYTPTTADVRITFDVTGQNGAMTTDAIRAVAIP